MTKWVFSEKKMKIKNRISTIIPSKKIIFYSKKGKKPKLKNLPLLIRYGDDGVKNLAKTFLGEVLLNSSYEISFGFGVVFIWKPGYALL